MTETITNTAGALLAPKVLRAIRFRWLVYGAAAYLTLRFLNKRGILPRQTGAALDAIDHGFSALKERFVPTAEAPTLH
jgi:hypothetical protein